MIIIPIYTICTATILYYNIPYNKLKNPTQTHINTVGKTNYYFLNEINQIVSLKFHVITELSHCISSVFISRFVLNDWEGHFAIDIHLIILPFIITIIPMFM